MGSAFDTWNDVVASGGAYYPGVGTSWEMIWLLISIAICVVALWIGGKHESDAYRRAGSDNTGI